MPDPHACTREQLKTESSPVINMRSIIIFIILYYISCSSWPTILNCCTMTPTTGSYYFRSGSWFFGRFPYCGVFLTLFDLESLSFDGIKMTSSSTHYALVNLLLRTSQTVRHPWRLPQFSLVAILVSKLALYVETACTLSAAPSFCKDRLLSLIFGMNGIGGSFP